MFKYSPLIVAGIIVTFNHNETDRVIYQAAATQVVVLMCCYWILCHMETIAKALLKKQEDPHHD